MAFGYVFPQVKEFKKSWNLGFHAVDSRSQVLDSEFLVSGTWILDSDRLLDSGFRSLVEFRIPIASGIPDSGFQSLMRFRIPIVSGIPYSDRQWDSIFRSLVGFSIPIVSGIPDSNR